MGRVPVSLDGLFPSCSQSSHPYPISLSRPRRHVLLSSAPSCAPLLCLIPSISSSPAAALLTEGASSNAGSLTRGKKGLNRNWTSSWSDDKLEHWTASDDSARRHRSALARTECVR